MYALSLDQSAFSSSVNELMDNREGFILRILRILFVLRILKFPGLAISNNGQDIQIYACMYIFLRI